MPRRIQPANRDRLTKEQRSWNMSRIRSKDTKPEMIVRRLLHAMSVRYRLHRATLPGKPDIVLGPRRLVIFVHGCFWHRHPGCRYTSIPSTRPDFWQTKFEVNVVRDNAARGALLAAGWRVATVWDCAVRKPQQVEFAVNLLASWLRSGAAEIEIGETQMVAERADG